jgi:Bacterial regulatory helix-turn-helix protein, lysR family
MEMHQVHDVLAVARALTFTRAAEECHVTQPSLTLAIRQLEGELGAGICFGASGRTPKSLNWVSACCSLKVSRSSSSSSMIRNLRAAHLLISTTFSGSLAVLVRAHLVRNLPPLEATFGEPGIGARSGALDELVRMRKVVG